MHQIRLFFTALQFLTRLPVPRWVGFEPAWLNQCAGYFVLVGFCVGAIGALALSLAALILPAMVAVILSLMVTVLLTCGFHEDGLADTFDALGGAVSRERALLIMKDSRIGSYGALALTLMLALKISVLVELVKTNPATACVALVFLQGASRFGPLLIMASLPYARDVAHAKAKPLAQQIGRTAFVIATGTMALGAAIVLVWQPTERLALSASILTLLGISAALRAWFKARLGGFTGDTLGATQQITETAALLAWLACVPCR